MPSLSKAPRAFVAFQQGFFFGQNDDFSVFFGSVFFFFLTQGLFSAFDFSIYKSERKELQRVNFVKCLL